MKQILILEDNELTRNKLIRLIESMNLNINVFAFSNEEEALGCALTHHIDLFLVDIILRPQIKNDFSGIHFTEKNKRVSIQRMCRGGVYHITCRFGSRFASSRALL